jgi:hypothetical protein
MEDDIATRDEILHKVGIRNVAKAQLQFALQAGSAEVAEVARRVPAVVADQSPRVQSRPEQRIDQVTPNEAPRTGDQALHRSTPRRAFDFIQTFCYSGDEAYRRKENRVRPLRTGVKALKIQSLCWFSGPGGTWFGRARKLNFRRTSYSQSHQMTAGFTANRTVIPHPQG